MRLWTIDSGAIDSGAIDLGAIDWFGQITFNINYQKRRRVVTNRYM